MNFIKLPLTVGALLVANAAVAVPVIDILDIDSEFTSWTPASVAAVVSDGLNGGTVSEIRWPAPVDLDDSGYTFSETPTPVNGILPADFVANDFVIGDFSHYNFPISSSITEAVLEVSLNGQVRDDADDSVIGTFNLTSEFTFTHNETTNNATPCADGGDNYVGVNLNGCADSVTVSSSSTAGGAVYVDGQLYELEVIGFVTNGGVFTQWWTMEDSENTAQLVAGLVVSDDEGDDDTVVPTPGAGLLFLSGLGALIFGRRRKV